MLNNGFLVDQKMLDSRQKELLRVAESERGMSSVKSKLDIPLHAKALSMLGNKLVQTGFWLQNASARP